MADLHSPVGGAICAVWRPRVCVCVSRWSGFMAHCGSSLTLCFTITTVISIVLRRQMFPAGTINLMFVCWHFSLRADNTTTMVRLHSVVMAINDSHLFSGRINVFETSFSRITDSVCGRKGRDVHTGTVNTKKKVSNSNAKYSKMDKNKRSKINQK